MTVLLRQRESGYNMMLDLERFIKAQDTDYETALNEIKAGRKKKSLDLVHISPASRVGA